MIGPFVTMLSESTNIKLPDKDVENRFSNISNERIVPFRSNVTPEEHTNEASLSTYSPAY